MSNKKTIFISTGEVSGDLQGAMLVTALKQLAEKTGIELNIVGLGGKKMLAAGANILADTMGISGMGTIEVVSFIVPTIQVQNIAKKYLKATPPDVIVLIDYMGPNIVIGKYARATFPNVPIIYYIAPQEWVWSANQKKTSSLIDFSDQILSIFPAEAAYFAKQGANTKFVGHPLIDRMITLPSREFSRSSLGIPDDEIAIALIPASRKQELTYLLPAIFEAAQKIQAQVPNIRFWIPLSRDAFAENIQQAIDLYQLNATLVTENPDLVLTAADYAITKCGTVTLELAILNIPQVVVYRLSKFTAWFARKILGFSLPFMSPPNLIEMKPIVTELMQEDVNGDRIATEMLELILNQAKRDKMLDDYAQMRLALGESGVCDRVAQEILAKV